MLLNFGEILLGVADILPKCYGFFRICQNIKNIFQNVCPKNYILCIVDTIDNMKNYD